MRGCRSEVELHPQPVQVTHRRPAPGVDVVDHGAIENGTLPVEINLNRFVEVPVQASVDHLGVIGPEVWIRKTGGEDTAIQLDRAVARRHLERAEAEAAVPQIKAAEGFDKGAVADRLARENV